MKTISINLYQFSELSEEAKQKAIAEWYKHEDFPTLSNDLTESLRALLEQNGCEYANLKLLYSLGYSQGDGLCFTGQISKDGKTLYLTHSYRYYYAKSVTMELTNEDGEEIDETGEDLTDIYFKVCAELEKEGYGILEYRMNNEEFSEHCEANEYTFEADGKMNNG